MTRNVNAGDGADLARQFGDLLLEVRSPWHTWISDGASADGAAAVYGLRNPYWIEDQLGGYHTAGWATASGSRSRRSMVQPPSKSITYRP